MSKPVTLRCGHSGCFDCFDNLLQYHEQKGNSKAPCHICRSHAFGRDSLTVNFALDSVTRQLDVTCANQDCLWKGKFHQAEKHHNECIYRLVKCPNNNCQMIMKRENIDAHWMLCAKQTVLCPDCQKLVERDEMSSHTQRGCIYAKMSCPLGCGMNLLW